MEKSRSGQSRRYAQRPDDHIRQGNHANEFLFHLSGGIIIIIIHYSSVSIEETKIHNKKTMLPCTIRPHQTNSQ
jgi:hypothetical protein